MPATELLCVGCLRLAGEWADASKLETFTIDRARSYVNFKPPAGKIGTFQIPSAITVWQGSALCLGCLNNAARKSRVASQAAKR